MKTIQHFLLLSLFLFAACTPTPQAAQIPTLAVLPSVTPSPTRTATSTDTLTPTVTLTPTATDTPSPTWTPNVLATQVIEGNATNQAMQATLAALWTSLAPTDTPTITDTPQATLTPSLTITNTVTPTRTPEQVVTIQPQRVYARSAVNLRTCANRNCVSVAQINGGESVMATGTINGEDVYPGNTLWYQVDEQGQPAFVYSGLVSLTPPTLPPIPPPTLLPTATPLAVGYICADGSVSYAQQPQGACSSHGGIAGAQTPTQDPYQSPPYVPPIPATVSGDSSGGFLCKDGTISHAAHRQGACSYHGGIAN